MLLRMGVTMTAARRDPIRNCRQRQKSQSFLDKVLNCTLLGDDDGSDDDEETYTRDGDMEATTTFETEDESLPTASSSATTLG